jgi:hypothetical protein
MMIVRVRGNGRDPRGFAIPRVDCLLHLPAEDSGQRESAAQIHNRTIEALPPAERSDRSLDFTHPCL